MVECNAVKTGNHESDALGYSLFNVSPTTIEEWEVKREDMKVPLFLHKKEGSQNLKIEEILKTPYSIHHSPRHTNSGVRVLQRSCWEKMIDLFSIDSIKSDTLHVAKHTGEIVNLSIFGTFNYE